MAGLVPFTIDLTSHEGVRLAAVVEAIGSEWDPTAVFTGETQAYQKLYADLDPHQQATYEVLVAADVLPDISEP
ncbi:MAG: hypothetical protein JO296_21210 [Pseudonocardiales bacterium]|jgi:Family of unknown function (DUF6400)|nr:hypothetical protein [Pseudonocardiales bacterium]